MTVSKPVPQSQSYQRCVTGFVRTVPVARGLDAGVRAGIEGSQQVWHGDGMNRARLSTTADATLLEHARGVRFAVSDAVLVDEALTALLARHRAAEVDASYAAYDEPIEEPDEWGDLASFRRAVAAS